MPIIEKRYSGIMNLDDNADVMPSSHHKSASNVVFRGNPGAMQTQNVWGTRLINNPNLHSGTNVCIGSHYDSLKNRVFYFVHNVDPSDGLNYHGIFMYDANANTVTRLLMQYVNSVVPLFYFSRFNPIVSTNILYRPDEDGDILFWTDGLNRPMKLNIKDALDARYGNFWLNQYLTVSQYVPQFSPLCKYNDDPSTNINNLKNKVFQFSYRWVYSDNTKSTFSPWSRMFTPANVDTLATEIDPKKNNVINVTYQTGAANVKAIEIIARHSLSDTYTDAYLVSYIDKASNGISSNGTQQYNFYNSEAYPFLDPQETTQLFSLIPSKANAQELLNGNQLIYGGITEGKTLDTELNITSSVSLVTNTANPNFTYELYNNVVTVINNSYDPPREEYSSGSYYITLAGVPNVGETYTFDITMRRFNPATQDYQILTSTITITIGAGNANFTYIQGQLSSLLAADANMITCDLFNKITALNGSDALYPGLYGVKIAGSTLAQGWVLYVSNIQYTYNSPSLPVDPTGLNTACYKHNARYGFGICYFNEYGETNGVNSINSMNILTPEIVSSQLGVVALTIPAIQFNVSNPPPTWAKSYSFVRTLDLTYSNFYTIFTNKTYKDTDFGYLDITTFQTGTEQYIKYDFAKGDRVRLVGKKNNVAATTVPDYPILDLLINPTISGTARTGQFLKVQYDATTMSTFGTDDEWYIEVYTPAVNTISSGTQVYYEFGETYAVATDVNGNRVHTGQLQNQIIGIGAQPAIFKFYRGDVYTRKRNNLFIIDQSLSDKFASQVAGNGRPLIQDPSAKETYYPTLVRYSLTYNPGTVINETNVFYVANFDEYDRSRGDIRRLKVRGSQMRVFQSRGVGSVGVLENMLFNADGSDNLIQTNKIINQIHYYQGAYGMGWNNASLASSANADYFVDPVRGYQLRVAGDGITPISEIYKAQYYMTDLATEYIKPINGNLGGYAKILGAYDFFEEQYIAVFQPTATLPNVTLAFNEARNCYTSFFDYSPEMITSIEGRIVSFRSGNIYVHDDAVNYNRFYGTQYSASITFIFNEQGVIKKDFNAITQDADTPWTSPTNGDITTALGQSSNLVASDYVKYEGLYNAAFMRDANSLGGVIEGDYLKGVWMQVKLSNSSTNLVYLSGLYVNYTPSQRNL